MVHTQIEIAASPEECRKVVSGQLYGHMIDECQLAALQLMDFENWSKIGNGMIRSVSRLPTSNGGPVKPGEVLSVDFSGNKSLAAVLVS